MEAARHRKSTRRTAEGRWTVFRALGDDSHRDEEHDGDAESDLVHVDSSSIVSGVYLVCA
jgi:hypothetical protein